MLSDLILRGLRRDATGLRLDPVALEALSQELEVMDSGARLFAALEECLMVAGFVRKTQNAVTAAAQLIELVSRWLPRLDELAGAEVHQLGHIDRLHRELKAQREALEQPRGPAAALAGKSAGGVGLRQKANPSGKPGVVGPSNLKRG
jgi:hypothetical protein